MTIEPLTAEWTDAAATLEKRAGDVGWSKEQFAQELTLPFSRFFVLTEGPALLGYAGFWKVQEEAQITNVVVAPEHRRAGAGLRLLTHLLETARQERCARGTLEVRADNAAAIALYKKIGFTGVGRRPGFYNGVDALLMEMTL